MVTSVYIFLIGYLKANGNFFLIIPIKLYYFKLRSESFIECYALSLHTNLI